MTKRKLIEVEDIQKGKFYFRVVPLINDKYEMGHYLYILDIVQLANGPGGYLDQTMIMFDVYNNYFQLVKHESFQAVMFETFIDKKQMYEIEFESEGEEAKWLMMLN